MSAPTGKHAIIWFRNDLRLVDNEALVRACEGAETVTAVYCVSPREREQTRWGFARQSARRASFLLDALLSLQEELRGAGNDLLVVVGQAPTILPALAKRISATDIYFHREAAHDEVREEERLAQGLEGSGVRLHAIWGLSLIHIDDLPFSLEKLPRAFTPFRHKVEKKSSVRNAVSPIVRLPPNAAPELFDDQSDPCWQPPEELTLHAMRLDEVTEKKFDERDQNRFCGDRRSGLTRIKHFFWESDSLRGYKHTRNGMLKADDSSKLSPWLAHGVLSPREVYWEIERYEGERFKNESTYWLKFELLWRDYFRFVALKAGYKMFIEEGLQEGGQPREKRRRSFDEHLFGAWTRGETGYPIVDANMRELAATGFMSNRGRQITASFLVNDLEQPWLAGAAWFESQLLDYDPCSNYGNWAYIVGVGNDPRRGRYFDLAFQAERYDASGSYVKHWIRELKNVPETSVHAPWTLDENLYIERCTPLKTERSVQYETKAHHQRKRSRNHRSRMG